MVGAAKKLQLPKPWFLLAHSMGACIGTRSMQNILDVETCIFTAPMFDIHLSSIERIAVGPLTWIFKVLGKAIHMHQDTRNNYAQTVEFEKNRLTNDELYQYWVEQGTVMNLVIGGPTMGWRKPHFGDKALRSAPSPNVRVLPTVEMKML